MRNAFTLGLAACAGALFTIAPASALPAGIGQAVKVQASGRSLVEKAEFVRLRDGSVEYRRPRFNDKGPYFFAYRGYAYPYYPGYTYRLYRGKLKPYDRPHRYRIAD